MFCNVCRIRCSQAQSDHLTGLHMIWHCPKCLNELTEQDPRLSCAGCGSQYEKFGGIPDLRLPRRSWIDYEADREEARRLLADAAAMRPEELVRRVFSLRPDWTKVRVENCTGKVITGPNRARTDIDGWLKMHVNGGFFLEVGCGPGALLLATAQRGYRGAGIDVSLVWLVVAQKLMLAAGYQPTLAAANGEALPIATSSVPAIVALDVIEHVADRDQFVSEMARVTKPGGCIALSTPNRFSLGAEPHVSIWGVGWLPRRWQKSYVNWRTGDRYESTVLLSLRDLRQLFERNSFNAEIVTPSIDESEIAKFGPRRAVLAKIYNRLVTLRLLHRLFLRVGPFFRIVGRKRDGIGGT
jgi:2-polyprenyl-3-methyl-5-hydroxy-6-metoxy-1,4-benzoquinol methylase